MNTMETTAKLLCNAMFMDTWNSMTAPVLTDYGFLNIDEIHWNTLYGVYQGLVKHKGVTAEHLHMCFMANRLDELIHKKYKHNRSGYYDNFVANGIKLGNTKSNLNSLDAQSNDFKILDDDTCYVCESPGYNQRMCNPPDCAICFTFMCTDCARFAYNVNSVYTKNETHNSEQETICVRCYDTLA